MNEKKYSCSGSSFFREEPAMLIDTLSNFSDGMSRAGVYCAANACIEQVIQHGEVDVFQAVKTVRRHRPQLINNMVYTTCYLLCYLSILLILKLYKNSIKKCISIYVHQRIPI